MKYVRSLLPQTLRSRAGAAPLWAVAVVIFLLSICFAPRMSAGSESHRLTVSAIPDLAAIERAFQRVVTDVSPSVVGIRAQRHYATALATHDAGDPPATLEHHVVVNGSGTIVDPDGLILTNEHVVQGAGQITVLFHDGTELPAQVYAADPRSDLAVLRVARTGLQPARFCEWDRVARGQWTIVVGNPFGLGSDGQLSVATGVVSNLGRQLPGLGEVDDRFYNNMIQTTAPINPGHSGGPLFNVEGELIGVVTAMHTRAPADEGIGFAIPMTPTKCRVIRKLCEGQDVQYGYIGLTVRVPEEDERELFNLSSHDGVVVQLVEPGGPAAEADIRVGDVIRRFDDQPVTGPAQMAELVGQTPVGAEVRLAVLRTGRRLPPQYITVQRRDISRVSWMRSGSILWRGMRLVDLGAEVRKLMRVDETVHGVLVIEVLPDTPADRADFEIGDLIERIDGEPVRDTTEFLLRARATDGALRLAIRHRGNRIVLAD